MRVRETAEGEGQEGGEAPVEHRGPDRAHRGHCAIFPWTLDWRGRLTGDDKLWFYLGDHEGQPYVDWIVDTEPDGEDDVDARDDVDGDVPEVEEADDVGEGDDDDADDVDADADVCEQHKGDQGHRRHGKPDVSPELKSDYLVCLPGSVDFAGDQMDHGRVFLSICQTFWNIWDIRKNMKGAPYWKCEHIWNLLDIFETCERSCREPPIESALQSLPGGQGCALLGPANIFQFHC